MASHDDATPEHVQESIADGASVAEFPTTLEAAAASHAAGIAVLMGPPIWSGAVRIPATSPPRRWRARVCSTSSPPTTYPPTC
jgi:hypothetical protein